MACGLVLAGCGGDGGASDAGGSSSSSTTASGGDTATSPGTSLTATTSTSTTVGTTSTSTGADTGSDTTAGTGSSSTGGQPTGIQTVFIILFENHDWSTIKDSDSAPYLNSLLEQAAWAEAYHNVPDATLHPSEPNYVWLEAGDALGFTDDSDPGPDNCAVGEDHLTKQLEAAGISWKSYQEDIDGGSCPLSGTGNYAPKHNPMIFFDDVSGTDCNDPNAAELPGPRAPVHGPRR